MSLSLNRPDHSAQLDMLSTGSDAEHSGYLTDQLLTYIGNKRSLIDEISAAVFEVKQRLGRERLRVLDAFSGSGVVSRYLKRHASHITTIDLEDYAAAVARCFLMNRSEVDGEAVARTADDLNARVDSADLEPGFIEELYAPQCEKKITAGERVFYTPSNARRIDNFRRMLDQVPEPTRTLLMGSLLSKASVHANTSGVFKGFHKDRRTKIGRFGGTNRDALKRIMGEITLVPPTLSRFECEVDVRQGDANEIAPTLKDLDLVYLDPPYNQHPYGSNYFMLNLVLNYERPNEVSQVSGIPVDWKRSDYNVRAKALRSFSELVHSLRSRFLLVSFNNEGFISREEMLETLEHVGKVEVFDIKYNTFRGCRNIQNRSIHVTEHMFLVECG